MHTGIAIKTVRKELNIPQYKLAIKLGISSGSLSQLEIRIKSPSPKTIETFCEIFDVPLSIVYILSLEEKDISKNMRRKYRMLYPSLRSLTLRMFTSRSIIK